MLDSQVNRTRSGPAEWKRLFRVNRADASLDVEPPWHDAKPPEGSTRWYHYQYVGHASTKLFKSSIMDNAPGHISAWNLSSHWEPVHIYVAHENNTRLKMNYVAGMPVYYTCRSQQISINETESNFCHYTAHTEMKMSLWLHFRPWHFVIFTSPGSAIEDNVFNITFLVHCLKTVSANERRRLFSLAESVPREISDKRENTSFTFISLGLAGTTSIKNRLIFLW